MPISQTLAMTRARQFIFAERVPGDLFVLKRRRPPAPDLILGTYPFKEMLEAKNIEQLVFALTHMGLPEDRLDEARQMAASLKEPPAKRVSLLAKHFKVDAWTRPRTAFNAHYASRNHA